MNQFQVVAEPRAESGKAASRRLRRTGKVPAVLYGAGKVPQSIVIDENTIKHQLEYEGFFSHILVVKIGSEETQVVLKDLQRDPATQKVTHADFLRVSAENEITMNVPLHFLNEETSPGAVAGGVVSHLQVDLEISCLPRHLPEYIEIDVGGLDIGDSLHLSDVKLPEGVALTVDLEDPTNDRSVVTVQAARDYEEEEEAEAAEAAEALEAAEGEAGEGAEEDTGEGEPGEGSGGEESS